VPRGFPLIPENEDLDFEGRELMHFSHRVIFTVEGEGATGTVHVLRIYHSARGPLKPSDFESEM